MIRIKISEAQGTVNVEELHNLQEQLQVLNEELNMSNDNKNYLEKQLKSIEVSVNKTIIMII